jgi:hypothetical protein
VPEVRPATWEYVLVRAGFRCEYCHMLGWWLEPDHIIPRSRWAEFGDGPGLHDAPNLAAACVSCNKSKWRHVDGVDPLTGLRHPLFSPRLSDWKDHFAFTDDGLNLVGLSPVGRVTVNRLRMNRPPYRQQRQILRLAARSGAFLWPD